MKVAHEVIPKDPRSCENLDYLRSSSLLALTAIQNGNVRDFHFWLGIYYTFLRIDNLENEDCWPKEISKIELEERRRLIWSMYTLEIFSAACFDTPIYCREIQTRVSYPEEIDDELLDQVASGSEDSTMSRHAGATNETARLSWLHGWNFVTDLYRVLEYVIDRRRAKENTSGDSIAARTLSTETASPGMHVHLAFHSYGTDLFEAVVSELIADP